MTGKSAPLSEKIFNRGALTWRVFKAPLPTGGHSNHLAVSAGASSALINPGGSYAFPAVLAAVAAELALETVKHLIFPQFDTDTCSGLPLWHDIFRENAAVYVPDVWAEGLGRASGLESIQTVPEGGSDVMFGKDGHLKFISASLLPTPGAFSIYDPEARVLFSGAIGCSNPSEGERPGAPTPSLLDHHRRWIHVPWARDMWLAEVADLDIDVMVPMSGPILKGPDVSDFLDWFRAFTITAPGASASVKASADALPDLSPPAGIAAPPPMAAPVPPPPPPVDGKPADSITGLGAVMIRRIHEAGRKYRLVTRSDFDGLVCAVLLEDLEIIDDIMFAHPAEVQNGEIDLSKGDIITNLPFDPRVFLSFDHHKSETARVGRGHSNLVIDPAAPSAARVVYDYFGGEEAFPGISDEMMTAVDKADTAQFTRAEVVDPKGWSLLNFVMDPRTGLGRFHGFRIPNYELMMSLIEDVQTHSIEEVLSLPDVKERVDLLRQHRPLFEQQLRRCTQVIGNLALVDLRGEPTLYAGNRFLIYAMFPNCNISLHVLWGKQRQNTVFAVGKSIFDRSNQVDVGQLMLEYGGGGHRAAGTCQADNDLSEDIKGALVARLNGDEDPTADPNQSPAQVMNLAPGSNPATA